MIAELVLRFVLGGVIVSAFALVGEALHPKSFAGLFGAAPSVAIASLAVAYAVHGEDYVRTEAAWMLVGSAGLFAYAATSVALARREAVPVWLGAGAAWLAWFAVAFGIAFALQPSGFGQ